MELTRMCYAVGGILISTYIVNAIGATFYGTNCISPLSYNSPICATSLVVLTASATVNYWIYYATITTVGMAGIANIKKLFTK